MQCRIEGRGLVFNSQSQILKCPISKLKAATSDTTQARSIIDKCERRGMDYIDFVETIAPDAILGTLEEIPLLYEHVEDYQLGKANLRYNENGVYFWSVINPSEDHGSLTWDKIYTIISSLEEQQSHCSFGFYCRKDSWKLVNGIYHRRVEKLTLTEISVVGMPAYAETYSHGCTWLKTALEYKRWLEVESKDKKLQLMEARLKMYQREARMKESLHDGSVSWSEVKAERERLKVEYNKLKGDKNGNIK